MLRDGRLNLGELTLPVAIDKLPQSYSMLSTDVSTFFSNFFFFSRKEIKRDTTLKKLKETQLLSPFFMDMIQMPQGCRATTRKQFTFDHLVPGVFGIHLKDARS